MWRAFFLAVGFLGVLGTLFILYVGISAFRPEMLNPDLKQEFLIGGLMIGQSTPEQAIQRLGPPETERQSTGTLILEYPSQGVLLRFDNHDQALAWYEITSTRYATGMGVQVGDSVNAIRAAYGSKGEVVPIGTATRMRYYYGQAYGMEFWLDAEQKVTKIVFFRA